MQVWLNGRFLDDPSAPGLSPLDHAVTVGDGVFEVVKVVDNQPFALTRHLARLQRSAAGLGLPVPDPEEVRRAVTAVLDREPIPIGRVRITWTPGVSPLGSSRTSTPEPTLLVVAVAADPKPQTSAAISVPWARNEKGALTGLKTTSYAENALALARAEAQGATEAIFANTEGLLCEGTGTNVFYVVDGELRTPSLASGCLAGVTRALVLEWCGAREIDEPIEVLDTADEIFLTSTNRDVQGLTRYNDRILDAPGPVTEKCSAIWRDREAADHDPA